MASIFVSIASYKDPELLPTIKDCLNKSSSKNAIHIGVAWQHGIEEQNPNKIFSNISVLDILAEESRGACWARAEIQKKLFNNEDYYFQIDSHHRFSHNWDNDLIEMFAQCDSSKPILTTYVPAYNPSTFSDNKWNKINFWGMVAGDFCKNSSILLFRPNVFEAVNKPLKSRFLSAHCLFTKSSFIHEVAYDEDLYFSGEEITLAVRSYTHGFDLFCPNKVFMLHEYTRNGRVKHWDEHGRKNGTTPWFERDKISKNKCEQILTASEKEARQIPFGLGSIRTRTDYEIYAGIDFKNKRIHEDAKKFYYVNQDQNLRQWFKESKIYSVKCDISSKDILQNDDIDFCFIGFEDKKDNLLFRHDLSDSSLKDYISGKKTIFQADIESKTIPSRCVVWPHSKNDKWLNKVTKNVSVIIKNIKQ